MILGNDEFVINPLEIRRLRHRRKLTGRTLFIEGVNDDRVADLVALHALRIAVENRCAYIVVRGKTWKREFSVKEMNDRIGQSPFRHGHGAHSELDMKAVGGKETYFDTTRPLWQVPATIPPASPKANEGGEKPTSPEKEPGGFVEKED